MTRWALKPKRSECVFLYLTLKRRWYDMIAKGIKEEEYRDYKPFWASRIERWSATVSKHRVVAFSLGRRRADMFFLCEPIGSGVEPARLYFKSCIHPEWGEPRTPHYVIPLSSRVEFEDESEVAK